MTLIADVYFNLRTPKDVVRSMSKKSRFRGPFHKWRGKRGETLFKAERQHLYHIYWSLSRQFRLKKSFWVICKILGLFVNPLRADLKYSLLNKGNLLQHLQMPLSQKLKIFSQLFFAFPKLRFNFEHFSKKDDLHSWRISELTDSKKRVWRKV